MTGQRKVFHLVKSLGRGGAEMLLVEGPASQQGSHSYAFGYLVPWKNALVPELMKRSRRVICFPAASPPAMLAQVPAIAAELKNWGADIVHCHLPWASLVGRLAGRLAGIPVISTEHNLLERYHPLTRWASVRTWRLQSAVIAVSDEVRESIWRLAGRKVPVAVIKNGVSLTRFAPSPERRRVARRALGVPKDAVVLGTVAVFREQKRLDLWLEVARIALASCPNVTAIVVGDGPLRSMVEEKRSQLPQPERVVLTGLQKDVRPYLSCMDIFMVASDFEGLPVALLEAMAMEVVPVVTEVGGMPEVVKGGTNGFVCRAGDVHGLASRVVALARDPHLRLEVGRQARATIEQRLSIARMMADTESLYEKVLQGTL